MSEQHAFKASTARAQQPRGRLHLAHRPRQVEHGAYTVAQVLARISMTRSTFYRLKAQGDLPFLEELKPRLGRRVRYRADLVDQFVANTFNRGI